ncbi:MAG TPA: sigma-70 family RNA polymerase sigma factor, partial [Isosphaeraceae bacterium]
DRLIGANLGLVVAVASGYLGRGLAIDDLVGEGNVGLVRAADRFDPGVGARFPTYAAYWIRQAILRALAETTATIRLPLYLVKLLRRWRRTEVRLGVELGRPPTESEVAQSLGLSAGQLDRARESLRAGRARSVDPAEWRCPRRSPEELAVEAEERALLGLRLARLDERGREILAARYGLGEVAPVTVREIGGRLGVTREWARKLELRALRALGAP